MFARLAAAALAALIYASPAAAGPVKDGVYDFSARGEIALNMRVAVNGKKIDYFFFDVPTNCRIGKARPHYTTVLSPPRDMVVRRDGTFGYTRVIRGPRPGAVQKFWVKGRFAADGRSVSVTGRYTLRRPDGGCDTKTRKAVGVLKGLGGSGPFTGPYAGHTEAGEAIKFNVERGRVTDIQTRATLSCPDGTTVVRDVRIAEVKIGEDGFESDEIQGDFPDQFRAKGTLTLRERPAASADDPDAGFCSATQTFSAVPARPLDS